MEWPQFLFFPSTPRGPQCQGTHWCYYKGWKLRGDYGEHRSRCSWRFLGECGGSSVLSKLGECKCKEVSSKPAFSDRTPDDKTLSISSGRISPWVKHVAQVAFLDPDHVLVQPRPPPKNWNNIKVILCKHVILLTKNRLLNNTASS